MAASDLNVTIGEKVVICQSDARRHHWFPTMLFRLNDGGIVLGFSLCPDTAGNVISSMAYRFCGLYDDNGQEPDGRAR